MIDLAVCLQSHLRSFWLACLVLSVWTPLALSQSVGLSLSSASGTPGSTVSLRVSLAGEVKPAGLQWSMNYSAMDLAFDNAQPGPAAVAAGKSIQCFGGSGTTTCLVFGFNQDTISNGVLAVFDFVIAPGTSAAFADVAVSGLSASSPEGNGIPVTGGGGRITIDRGAGGPSHQITGILDAASFQPLISPGAVVSVFGSFAEITTTSTTIPLAVELNGFSVTFNGVPGALFGIFGEDLGLGFHQANVQVPWEVAVDDNSVDVRVHWRDENGEIASEPFEVDLTPASPGIYEFPIGSGQAIVTNFKLSEEDDVIAGSFAQPDGQPAAIDGVVTIWLNGLGPVTPTVPTGDILAEGAPLSETDKTVRVWIGDVEARILGKPVLHPAFVALNQINVVVSPGTPTGDQVPIRIEVDCGDDAVFWSKEGVTIAVRRAP